jgi:hypothetical protein
MVAPYFDDPFASDCSGAYPLADIFREIDEDLRRDRMLQLWKRYGSWLIAGCILLVAGTGVYVGWQDWRARGQAAEAARFASAVATIQAGTTDAAILNLQALAGADQNGYGLIARIEAAALKARGSDPAGGLAALQVIADDASVDQTYRGLAQILWGLFAVDVAPRDAITARIQPLVAAGNPWRFVGGEILALAELKAGDRKAALKRYQTLADDLDAPQTQRARAAEIVTDLQD